MGRSIDHSLKLTFRGKQPLPHYCGEIYAPSRELPDAVHITSHAIAFQFSRTTRLAPDSALVNATRIDQIRRAMLFVSSKANAIPKVEAIEFDNGKAVYDLPVPKGVESWYCGANKPVVSIASASRVFSNGATDKAIALALTYICASRRFNLPTTQNERFRYLWSGFNALYRYIGNSEQVTHEYDMLACANTFLKEECACEVLLEQYDLHEPERLIESIKYYPFLLKRLSNKKGGLAGDWHSRLSGMDKVLLAKSKAITMKLASSDADAQVRFDKLLKEAPENDRTSQILFLICDYAYQLRNYYFHGESHYPLFPIEWDTTLVTISDLLETACVAIIERLSEKSAEL